MRGRHLPPDQNSIVGPDPLLSPATGLPAIIAVRWIDSGMAIDRGWARRERYLTDVRVDAMIAHTAGFLMHEDDDVVVISATYEPSGQTFYGAQVITKASIVERRVIG